MHQFNTSNETKKLFLQEKKYLTEINQSYRGCKNKKEKEQLKNNIANTLGAISGNITKSQQQVDAQRQQNVEVGKGYNANILAEKEHYLRLKEFEDQCELNDQYKGQGATLA